MRGFFGGGRRGIPLFKGTTSPRPFKGEPKTSPRPFKGGMGWAGFFQVSFNLTYFFLIANQNIIFYNSQKSSLEGGFRGMFYLFFSTTLLDFLQSLLPKPCQENRCTKDFSGEYEEHPHAPFEGKPQRDAVFGLLFT